MRSIILLTISFLSIIGCSRKSTIKKEAYSFFFAGHPYSLNSNKYGLHEGLRHKFTYINNRPEIKFGVFGGDIVFEATKKSWDNVDGALDSLHIPVHFSVGNHDMKDRKLYEHRYGNTYYHFIKNQDLFIFLDPTLDGWNISGKQLTFLKNTLVENHESVDNIFVFFHQLLWLKNDNIFKKIRPNSFKGRDKEINFWSVVEPLFHELPNKVFMFSGDLGAGYWSDDVMYYKYDNISFIASGMGVGKGDNIIIVNIEQDEVGYELICLGDTLDCMGDLSDYSVKGEL